MVIRLTRKLANRIDGVDISGYSVGDVVRLPFRAAKLLIAEGWAELIERRQESRDTQYALARRRFGPTLL